MVKSDILNVPFLSKNNRTVWFVRGYYCRRVIELPCLNGEARRRRTRRLSVKFKSSPGGDPLAPALRAASSRGSANAGQRYAARPAGSYPGRPRSRSQRPQRSQPPAAAPTVYATPRRRPSPGPARACTPRRYPAVTPSPSDHRNPDSPPGGCSPGACGRPARRPFSAAARILL